jgi:putative DNA methylase
LITPKTEELVASPYRFQGDEIPQWVGTDRDLAARWPKLHPQERAEAFFIRGMSVALKAMRDTAIEDQPLSIFYAFKQSEASEDGIVSPGWASFLQAVVSAGFAIDGTLAGSHREPRTNSWERHECVGLLGGTCLSEAH